MANILLPILPGTLPTGYCFTSWQQTLVDFADHLQAVLENGRAFYNYGDTKPAPEFQIYPWLNTNDMRWYRFSGQWITNHELLPGYHRWEVFSTESEIWSYDGGSDPPQDPATNPPTATSGAMWMLDTDFNGRSPMSPGVIPGSNPTKTLGYGENFGEGAHLQLEAEVGPHGHGLPTSINAMRTTLAPGSGSNNDDSISGSGFMGLATFTKAGDVAQVTMPVVHPVRGMCCIVRTGRIYRTVP